MKKMLYMIGNAHLDPVWLWRWQDGYEAARATFRSVLDRMNEYPDFVFTSAAVCYYEWIERTEPEMFEEIRARVKEGRWRMVGGWWIQPDCLIPSGEGFARQGLIGQRYLQEKFGVTARTGYNVDSFGHSGSLPKILRMSGMDRYVYMRPGIHERSYPAWTFYWQGPEGEGVEAFRIPFEYCTWPDSIEAHVDRCANEISNENGMMCFYGVGNHGGGPTRKNIESLHALNGVNDVELKLSHPDEYFDQVNPDRLPVVNGDLLHHASGCYAAHSGVKRWNRKAECALVTAEKWAAAAKIMLNREDRQQELLPAWKKVLFNQFHDILSGTSLVEGYDDARQDFGFALSKADEIINESLQSIAGHIDIPFVEGAQPYVVFNPHGFDASYPVQIELPTPKKACRLLDASGAEVPYQLLTPSAAAYGRSRLAFVAKVPAMGWQRYMLVPTERELSVQPDLHPSPVLENSCLRAEFDSASGEMISLVMKSTGEELLRSPSATLAFKDDSDTWSHAKLKFDGEPLPVELVSMRCVAEGDVLRTLRVTQRVGSSAVIRDYTLYRELDELFVKVRVDWRETQKCLKFAWPMTHNYMHVRAQAPFGFADREIDGEEYPMQQWVDVSGCTPGMETRPCGFAVLNDGKYAYDVHDRTLCFTVLRSPYYANHEPFVVEEGSDEFPVTDQGQQQFEIILFPHQGGQPSAELEQRGALLNMPLYIQPEYAHRGELEPCDSFACVEGGSVLLDAMKTAEDGTGDLILHLHETAREACDTVVKLHKLHVNIPLHFTPGQIRCVRVHGNGEVTMVDLLERPV